MDNETFVKLCDEAEAELNQQQQNTEAADKEVVDKETVDKEAADKEAMHKEAADKEAMHKEAADKEAMHKEAAQKEVVQKEVVEKETVGEEVTIQALISQREHRKLIYKRGNCRQRKINKTNFVYIGPRLQYPKSPAKPTLFVAEGAETIQNKRLICPGQFLHICNSEYVVVMVYWCGSKPQGRRRYSARSPFYGLLIQCPFPSPLPAPSKTAEQHYKRIEIAELMDPELSDPIARPHVCQKTVLLMMQHTSEIITKFGCDTQWWERPVLIKTKLRLGREMEAKAIASRLQAAKEAAQQAAKEAAQQAAKAAAREAAKERSRERSQAKTPPKTKKNSYKRARVTKKTVPITTHSSPPSVSPSSPDTHDSVQLRILNLLTKLVANKRTDKTPKPSDAPKNKTTDPVNTDTSSTPPPTSLPEKRPRTEHQYHPGLQQPPHLPSTPAPHPPVYYPQTYQQLPHPPSSTPHPPMYYPQSPPMHYQQPAQQHPTPIIYYPQPVPIMYTQPYPQPRPMYPKHVYSGSPSSRQIVLNL